ncbi:MULTISPECIES: pyruvate synthase subunit PorA [unclassified Methanopyrus]|uniref:pyruvate synthase subunit PorA n=1 Tax=Methanopyrus sp. SNP6 TaxID=1937005 RepID=UPI0011E5A447|nr:pyruvate synthase subunit PorA [Methanopyrus sp. SNP6]
MTEVRVINGNYAVAEAVRMVDVDVIAAYPITPQTPIVEYLSEFVSDGELDAEFIHVESEHSAISAVLGASATGARVFTATASQGLALMHEILFIASGLRLPIVMAVTNRALSAPINIWCDHSDSVAQRDTSWIQLYCESNQEVFDTVVQAYRIAEHEDVLLPVMVCLDGFTLSHTLEPVELPEEEEVRSFVGGYEPFHCYLDPEDPMTLGPVGDPDSYMEFKKMQHDAMEKACEVIGEVNREFSDEFGRSYGDGLIEEYNTEDADYVVIAMGSVCGTIKHVIDEERPDVGLVRVKAYRPFPGDRIVEVIQDKEGVVTIDRAHSYGAMPPLWTDVKAHAPDIDVSSTIAGLGGRDIRPQDVLEIIKVAEEGKGMDEPVWINVKV